MRYILTKKIATRLNNLDAELQDILYLPEFFKSSTKNERSERNSNGNNKSKPTEESSFVSAMPQDKHQNCSLINLPWLGEP